MRTPFGSPCRLLLPRTCLPPAEQPMAPPRDTAGSAGTHQQFQQADAPGRYNQKSTTFRNGTTESGWFYPTPAAVKAAADVRGARPAREFFRLWRLDSTSPARRQRGGLLPALPVRLELHVRHGAPRVARGPSPLNLCLRSPEVARALARGLRGALRVSRGRGYRGSRLALAARKTLGSVEKQQAARAKVYGTAGALLGTYTSNS